MQLVLVRKEAIFDALGKNRTRSLTVFRLVVLILVLPMPRGSVAWRQRDPRSCLVHLLPVKFMSELLPTRNRSPILSNDTEHLDVDFPCPNETHGAYVLPFKGYYPEKIVCLQPPPHPLSISVVSFLLPRRTALPRSSPSSILPPAATTAGHRQLSPNTIPGSSLSSIRRPTGLSARGRKSPTSSPPPPACGRSSWIVRQRPGKRPTLDNSSSDG